MQTLCFGINDYAGHENDLTKCVADARAFGKLFGGPVLLDHTVTRKNFLAAVPKWAASVPDWHAPHDYGVLTYSGHGTYLPDDNGDEPDGRDECLVMADLSTVRDDKFPTLMEPRRPKARLLIITDSCFSGTNYRMLHLPEDPHRARYLAPANLGIHGRALRRGRSPKPVALRNVVHIAACSDFEFAYEGEAHGVLSAALLAAYDPRLKIGAWFRAAVKLVEAGGYPQTPQINCSASALQWPVPALLAA